MKRCIIIALTLVAMAGAAFGEPVFVYVPAIALGLLALRAEGIAELYDRDDD